MDDNDLAELAALPAILDYLLKQRQPKHDDSSDPVWKETFKEANYLAQRFGATYARERRD